MRCPPTPEVTVLPELFEEDARRARVRAARGWPGRSSEPRRCASSRPQRGRHAATWPSQTAASARAEVRPATAGAGGRRLGRSLGRVHRSGPRCEGGRATSRSSSLGPGRRSTPWSSWAPPTWERHRARVIDDVGAPSVPGAGDRAAGGHRGGPAQPTIPCRAEKAEVELDLLVQQLSEAFGHQRPRALERVDAWRGLAPR